MDTMKTVDLGERAVGQGQPAFVIAEAGVNHNGDLATACGLVDAAVAAGADAVKFQTFNAELVASIGAPKAAYQLRTTDARESQLEMLKKLELSPQAHQELMDRCRQRGILFMSSPFDAASADLLEQVGVSVFKIASGEVTNLPLLKHVSGKGLPVILSTGMSDLSEVDEAIRVMRETGNERIVLLHCVSCYPAEAADSNLRAMGTMEREFGVPVGFSDHTTGIEVSLAAIALGACVIEKHLTLDRSMPGPDHCASLVPAEFAALARGVRTVESALGHGRKEPAAAEDDTMAVARRSLVAASDILEGTRLTEEMIAVKRPGTGLAPRELPRLVGRTARVPISAGTLLELDMLE